MNDLFTLVMVFSAGGLLGMLFFSGLWWTVRKLGSFRKPGLLVFGSLLLRTGIVLAGFYFLARNHGLRMLVMLLGFVVARHIVIGRARVMDPTISPG